MNCPIDRDSLSQIFANRFDLCTRQGYRDWALLLFDMGIPPREDPMDTFWTREEIADHRNYPLHPCSDLVFMYLPYEIPDRIARKNVPRQIGARLNVLD